MQSFSQVPRLLFGYNRNKIRPLYKRYRGCETANHRHDVSLKSESFQLLIDGSSLKPATRNIYVPGFCKFRRRHLPFADRMPFPNDSDEAVLEQRRHSYFRSRRFADDSHFQIDPAIS